MLHPWAFACKLWRVMETIEDVVLRYDRRGVSTLRPHVPADFCHQAATLLAARPGPVIVTTGFYILKTATPETDGPPGAIAIGRALERLGRPVLYVTDRACEAVMRGLTAAERVLTFPVTDEIASARHARQV